MSMADHQIGDRAHAAVFFDELATELSAALDLHPAGITQERAWLHFKQLGRKVSIDQIVTTLNRQVREGTLTSSKNHKNETVWRRSKSTSVPAPSPVIAPLAASEPVASDQTDAPEPSTPACPATAVPEPPAKPITIRIDVPSIEISDTDKQAVLERVTNGVRRFLSRDADPTNPREAPMAPKKAAPPARRPKGALERDITNALGDGPATIAALSKVLGVIEQSVRPVLMRMQKAKRVRRLADKTWELTAGGAKGADPILAGKPPVAEEKRKKGKAGRPRAPQMPPEIAEQLDRFTARLQPVEDLGRKVATLDQLIKVMPSAIAEQLSKIRTDFVRLAGA